ncbi:probable hexokinase-like 2 protein isoform X2 [Tripterygium wilfordii]|uniref:probable hexokinase-like 2 protein isoform X2 n=1 Tax=Tripterygium wilfordii TaxID=458696 RepID=UPI0018F80649|nr:probable hexokinase-like 2 protein isoform X2 [Tripterygium wilfordii]
MRKEALVVVAATAATAVVGITLFRRWQRRKERQWKGTHGILRKLARECATPVSKLWEVANDLVSEMEASLASQETFSTTLNMLVSYMASLPSGDEEGVYYGVNLRGTNFLILCARLGGKQKPISDLYREEIIIPSDVVTGTSQELFDFIAVEVEKFVSANPENRDTGGAEEKKLGFTWSYPVDQAAATSGSAIKWKSFSVDDTVGKALLNDLNRALQKHGVNMHVFALVDNAVGELAGGRYYNRDSVAAITLGMSTDAAYIEAAETVHKWCSPLPESGEMVFEKLVAGMYLGEIVRRVLLKMAQETGIFGENVPSKLATPFLLRSPDMAVMHQDTSEDHDGVDEKLNEIFGITNSSPMARELVAEVCDIVAERSARLAGAGIVGIIKKLGRIENKKSVVTIEGGLYEHYRVFRNYLHSSVWEMLGNDLSDNVRIEHSHGGPGAGAVFLAASANLNS